MTQQERLMLNSTLLVIDTSTAVMSLALLACEQVLAESNEAVDRRHSDKLLPAIQDLLTAGQMTMQDIKGIVVGLGPGSYTGVRIGVTAAKTLAWTLSLPVVGMSSLEACAYGIAEEQRAEWGNDELVWIVPLTDARRGRAYTALYEEQAERWQCLVADRVQPVDQWFTQIKTKYDKLALSERPQRLVFVGEVSQFEAIINESFSAEGRFNVQRLEQGMRALALGKLAQQRWNDSALENSHHLVPNYTQLAEAEANLLAKQK